MVWLTLLHLIGGVSVFGGALVSENRVVDDAAQNASSCQVRMWQNLLLLVVTTNTWDWTLRGHI